MRRGLLPLVWGMTLLTTPPVAAETITLGVLASRPEAMVEQRFQPLADYLSGQLAEREVRLRVLDQAQLDREIAHLHLDLVLTDPAHYLRIRSANSLTSALVTLVRGEGEAATSSLGGVIISRAENAAIRRLEDLAGRRVAIPAQGSFCGHLVQRFEFEQRHGRPPRASAFIASGGHDQVLEAVLAGDAEAGFLRSGVIEEWIAEGRLDPAQLRIINPQPLAGYPYRASTRLYPEWPVAALPHMESEIPRRVAAALLTLEPDHPAALAAGISGFKPPANYLAVEQLLRELRLPPYDKPPNMTLREVWQRHWLGIGVSGLFLIILAALLFKLVMRNRQLELSSRLLRESTAMRDAILKNLPDLVFLKDPAGRYLAANPLFERFFAALEREIVGHTDYEFLEPEEAELFRAHDRKALEAGKATRNEEWIRFKSDGKRVLLETTKVPIRADDGHLIGILGIGHDITERKRAEEAIRESEERLRESQQVARLGHYTYRVTEDRWTSSEELDRIFGVDGDYGRSTASWLQIVHPEIREEMERYFVEEILGRHQAFNREYPIIDQRSGLCKWVHGLGKLRLDEDGNPLELFGTIQDISERKQAEMKLRDSEALYQSLVDSLPIFVYRVDRDGRVLFVNRALLEDAGLTAEQVIGKTSHDLYPPHLADQYRADDQWVMTNRKPLHQTETNINPANGEAREVEVIKIPVIDANGEVSGVQGIFWDISERAAQERALHESQRKLIDAQIISRMGDFMWDLGSNRVEWSPGMYHLLGYDPDEAIDLEKVNAAIHHPEDRDRVMTWLQQGIDSGMERLEPREYRLIRKDGETLHVQTNGRIEYQDGKPVRVFGTGQDITRRKLAEQQLKLAADVFTYAREGIIITDPAGAILRVNDAFTRITGYRAEEVIGENPRILQSGRHDRHFYQALWRDLLGKGQWHGEIWNRRKNGQIYPQLLTISAVGDGDGKVAHYVSLFSDISAQKRHQRQLEHIAHHDALTNLPNRTLFADRLNQAMAQAKRRGVRLAVAYLDLDGFKEINDSHGHAMGDHLLMTLARRFQGAIREGDTIARLGGDEFVAVLIDIEQGDAADTLFQRLLEAAARPLEHNGVTLRVAASIGVTFYPQGQPLDGEQLLRQADQAMYQAKLEGKSRYHLFDAAQDQNQRSLHRTLEQVRTAMQRGELELLYQPRVNLRGGQVTGAEALLRWRHPSHGLLAPDAFLKDVVESPLILELGEWVIDQALRQAEQWRQQGLAIPVAVNVAARQLQQADFAERLKRLLARRQAPPRDALELEVLEVSALEDIDQVSQVIRACGEMGVAFALDDFGTGYSSLTYLRRLPAASLKIDRTFVRDMLDDPEDLAILTGILGLARAFRRQPVAEGVESREQGEMLLQLGCELAQGYYIAQPMPGRRLVEWARNWKPDPRCQRLPSLALEDQPILFAIVEHRAWIQRIEGYLKGERHLPPLLDERHCRFAQWLIDGRARRYGQSPLFSEIDTLHHEIHTQAKKLITLQHQGSNGKALDGLSKLFDLRDRLLKLLKKLALEATRGRQRSPPA